MNKYGNRIVFFAVLTIFLLLCTCNKDNNNKVYGLVTDLMQEQSIEGVDVRLEVNEVTSGSVNTTYKDIGFTKTDNKGSYLFEFESKMAITYRLSFSKEGYSPKTILINPSDVSAEYEINPKMFKPSTLKIRVRNTSPFNEQDQLILRITSSMNDHCNDCCHSNLRHYTGTYVDEYIICNIVGYDTAVLDIMVEKNQNKTNSQVELFCQPNDTINYNLYY